MSELINIESIMLGGDPEAFYKSIETGKFVPAYLVQKGDKYNPIPISDNGHAIQVDNCSVEYNFPPCKTAEEFVKENLFVQDYINRTICTPNNLTLEIVPCAEFDLKEIKAKRAWAIGCEPDFNAYSGDVNMPGKYVDGNRCCGGHVALSYNDFNEETNKLIVRAMDLFLSVPLMIMEPPSRRKEVYGKSGAYRNTFFGVEFRVCSNYIYSTPELMSWAFNQTLRALKFINEHYTNLPEIMTGNRLETIINSKDIDACQKLVKEYNLNVLTVKEAVMV